jgi:glycosyltransferase involved in cell wall biosynthesis
MQGKSVAHLTSVHARFDTRIFLKECRSLAAAGYRVSLVVSDGNGDEVSNGVQIIDVGCKPGRIARMTVTSRRILTRALELDADVYHLHDPELLTIANRLKSAGKAVIFDAHEDVPVQILGKPYLRPVFRKALSRSFAAYEARICRGLDAVATATPFIRDKFLRVNTNSVDINNYPIPDELVSPEVDFSGDRTNICYIGSISENRGIHEMVLAMELLDCTAHLSLCGTFEDEVVRSQVKAYAGWDRVDELGWLGRDDVRQVLSNAVAGLVTLRPLPNYLDSHPIKMFEYMSAGVPVIASDFQLWREIIEGSDCGICVDPEQPEEIAKAINYLVQNPTRAREMGENGRKAVQNTYNWPAEERKLVDLYDRVSRGEYG